MAEQREKQGVRRPRVNEQIRAQEVRLIDQTETMIGVVSLRTALQAAQEAGLDLVEVSPTAEPPVCRIMDFGKYIYAQDKKLAAAKKKQRQIEIKEIKFRSVTGEGDYWVKLRNLIRFLEKGDKVKVTLRFRGRELAHQELGLQMLERIQTDLASYGEIEQQPKREGRQLIMVVGPKKKS